MVDGKGLAVQRAWGWVTKMKVKKNLTDYLCCDLFCVVLSSSLLNLNVSALTELVYRVPIVQPGAGAIDTSVLKCLSLMA